MAQKEEVTYELLVYSGTRWEAQGTYSTNEQRTAVADAKSLAKVSTVKGVKVVKEFYDAKSRTSRSLTVYEHTPAAPKSKPSKSQAKPSKASMTGDAREQGQDAPEEKGASILGTLVKLLLSIVFSLATAMVVTQLTSLALKGVHSVGLFDKDDFLFFVFILVFIITALALITRILSNLKKLAPLTKPRQANPAKPKPAKRKRNQRLTPSVAEFKAEAAQAEKPDEEADKKQAEEERKKAEEEARKKAEEEAAKKSETDALSETVTMNAFAKDAFEVLQGDKSKQDAHTVFGLVLFLVGAIQALRHQHKLSDDVVKTVSVQALGRLGLSPERVQHFIEHTDEYLISNARYSEMFQTGRAAMGEYLEHNTGPRGSLSDALTDWEKPKSQTESTSQPITVLFTDIAGSTAMTQKLGDAGAQEVVRAHNRIVREAIQGFSGKEIKHTGDGIMASFPSASSGVEAAMEMQARTKSHNASDPGHPLGLKIGLNTGEPISEDDDLFGTTVQLAARIVDKADAGQILVSGSVHGLSQGKNLKFERFADLDMKGFDEAITVYTALWDKDAPVKDNVKADVKPASAPEPEFEAAEPDSSPEAEVVPEAEIVEAAPAEIQDVSTEANSGGEKTPAVAAAASDETTEIPEPEKSEKT